MLAWIQSNLATLLISLLLAAVVVAIVARLIKNKKQGKSTCGGNCAHCACAGSCHKK